MNKLGYEVTRPYALATIPAWCTDASTCPGLLLDDRRVILGDYPGNGESSAGERFEKPCGEMELIGPDANNVDHYFQYSYDVRVVYDNPDTNTLLVGSALALYNNSVQAQTLSEVFTTAFGWCRGMSSDTDDCVVAWAPYTVHEGGDITDGVVEQIQVTKSELGEVATYYAEFLCCSRSN